MSTSSEPLKYLWAANFDDGHFIKQPADDRYSKYVEGAEHNPSAFRDILDYQEKSDLAKFSLHSKDIMYMLDITTGVFTISGRLPDDVSPAFSLEDTPLVDRKLIFFRQIQQDFIDGVPQDPRVARYCIGYEGKNPEGKVEKKVIYING